MKKLVSVLLTLLVMAGVIAVAPVVASAAAPAGPNSTDSWDFTAATEDGGGIYGSGSWSWEQSTKTLTLNNLYLITDATTALHLPDSATIVLNGTNLIYSTATTSSAATFGIFVFGYLTITGNGSLSATSGTATGAGAAYTTGIHCEQTLTISGVTVSATGGESASNHSFGFFSRAFILSGSTVTATGNTRALETNYTVPSGYTFYTNTATTPSAAPLTGNGSTTVIGGTHKYAKIVAPAPVLTLSDSTWNPPATAFSTNIAVTSNVPWTANSNAASWLTVSPANGSNNGNFAINAAANTGAARTGTITVTGGGITRTVAVTQAGTATPTYTLTVVGGTGGGGSHVAGAVVNISATVPSGKVFVNWTTSSGGSFANANSASTTYTMPGNNATVTANFKDAPKMIFSTKYEANFLNWLLFFLGFGFIWMRF